MGEQLNMLDDKDEFARDDSWMVDLARVRPNALLRAIRTSFLNILDGWNKSTEPKLLRIRNILVYKQDVIDTALEERRVQGPLGR